MATFVKDKNGNYKYVADGGETPVNTRSLGFSSAYNSAPAPSRSLGFSSAYTTGAGADALKFGSSFLAPEQSPVLPQQQAQDSAGLPSKSPVQVPVTPQPQVQQESPITKFNQALLEMLKQAQKGTDNTALFNQQEALQREGINRQSQMTPESLRDLSPEQQRQIRSGSVAALEPEQDYVAAAIKARDNRLQNFESVLNTARQIGGDIMDNIAPSKGVVEGYKNMLLAGANLTSIPEEIRDEVVSGMNSSDLQKWQAANAKENSTATERASAATSGAIAMARPALEDSAGEDGYVDPGIYTRLRLDFSEKDVSVAAFDNAFALLLSPKERARLGVGEYSGIRSNGTEVGSINERSGW